MTPAIFDVVRCHWCSKNRPKFRVHRLASHQVICDDCLDWHYHALHFLGGEMPAGCQGCGRSSQQLREFLPGVERLRMYVVPKDGILQMLCAECIRPYTGKRADLYKGTQFGAETLKLI